MRTITSAQSEVYASILGARAARVKVEVDRTGSADWVELTSLNGFNFVQTCEWTSSIDSAIGTATITCFKNIFDLVLSPYMLASLINLPSALLGVFRKIRIYAAVVPFDAIPESGDYMLVFRGRIADFEIGPSTITLRCRDEMGDLADSFIEDTKQSYGNGSDIVHEVMQNILTDWGDQVWGNTITLYSPNGTGGTPYNAADSSGWAIANYLQNRMPVMDALRALSDQVGYDLRYKWHANTSDIQLVHSAPTRSSPSVDYTFSPSIYQVSRCGVDGLGIRNTVRISYWASQTQRTSVERTDATLESVYGHRWMEIAEEKTSQIDTSTEANSFGDAVVDDLKDPGLELTATLPFFPHAEVNDYYTFSADNINFDSDQSLAVKSLRHVVSGNGGGVTEVQCQGTPKSRSKTSWLSQQAVHSYRQIGPKNFGRTIGGNFNLIPNGDFTQWSDE